MESKGFHFVSHLYCITLTFHICIAQQLLKAKTTEIHKTDTAHKSNCVLQQGLDAIVLYSVIILSLLLPIFQYYCVNKAVVLIKNKKVSKILKNWAALIRSLSLSKYITPRSNHQISQMPGSLWRTSYKIERFHRAIGLGKATFQISDSLFCPDSYVQMQRDGKTWLHTLISDCSLWTAVCKISYFES